MHDQCIRTVADSNSSILLVGARGGKGRETGCQLPWHVWHEQWNVSKRNDEGVNLHIPPIGGRGAVGK